MPCFAVCTVTRERMKLLIDTDAFCKLAVSDLLHDAARLLGATIGECERLPALPHMLRRGTLRRRFGARGCDSLIETAEALPKIGQPATTWLDPLVSVQGIDPGEALIFAAAAEAEAMVVSGDKRALLALKELEAYQKILEGRIVVIEGILLRLCHELGTRMVRRRVAPLMTQDTVIRMCFSSQGSDPEEGLLSYYDDLRREVSPLVLWDPRQGARR